MVRETKLPLKTLALTFGDLLQASQLHQRTATALADLQTSKSQLIQSSKLAAVGQLAAGVAHELNTPIGSALMLVDLSMDTMGEEERGDLDRAAKELEKARDIVSKLLTYSRTKTSRIQRVSLAELAQDTLVLVGQQLRFENLAIELELGESAFAQANPHEVQQILINLLLNARDALHADAPEAAVIRVETRMAENHAELRVSDNGPGVSPENLEKIFDPFFTTKPVGVGTGLGLSISREMAVQNGGSLILENQEPGACFVLRFPAAAES